MASVTAHLTSLIQEAWKHQGFRKYLRNAGWLFTAKFVTLGASFLATIYVARELGPENYGQLSYALSFVALCSFLTLFSVESVLYRDLIRKPERRRELLGTVFIIRLIAGIFAATTATGLAFLAFGGDVSPILVLIISSSLLLNSFQVILFEFQARADSKYPALVAVSIAILLNLLKVAIVANGKGVIYLAAIILLESALYALAYVCIYARSTRESVLYWRFDRRYAASLLLDSAPLIVFSAFALIYTKVGQVFIKHLVNTSSVGIYDAAVRVAELWSFIPGLLIAALFPAIVNAKAVSEHLYSKRLGRLAAALLCIGAGTAVIITFLAPHLIYILYGEAFMEAAVLLRIYIWASVGSAVGALAIQYLITENFRKALAYIALLPMAASVILNMLLIPRYGTVGAAYVSVISYTLMPCMLLCFARTRTQVVRSVRALSQSH